MASVKLEERPRAKGRKRIFLAINRDGDRKYSALDLWIEKETKANQSKNNETRKLAENVRKDVEIKLARGEYNFELRKQKKSFTKYFEEFSKGRAGHNFSTAYKRFNAFAGEVKFCDLDRGLCERFLKHLVDLEYATNTVNTLYAKFKAAIANAVTEGIISVNPAFRLYLKDEPAERTFLTLEEIKLLAMTPIRRFDDLKSAFLFSCFTGLRLCDIEELDYTQIKDGRLTYQQRKTKDFVYIKLPAQSLNYIDSKRMSGKVFDIPARTTVKYSITGWGAAAGLRKHITFHVARHTAASLLIQSGVDIYTVSKLIGHKNVKTTQIYAHMLDKKKDEAIDMLPTF
jgi:integrase